MKVLTKYFKVVLCFLAFALCSFMFAFTPTLTAVQAAELLVADYNVAINALKMPTEKVDYAEQDVFEVPLLDSVMGAKKTNYVIRVVDTSGVAHDFDAATGKSVSTDDTSFFSYTAGDSKVVVHAKNDGEYKVVYIVTEGGKTYYSNTYKVEVANVSYELDFSSPVLNTSKEVVGTEKHLIKKKLAVNEVYELPVAYAKQTGEDLSLDAEGKVTNASTANQLVKIEVTKNGSPQKVDIADSIFTSKTEAGVTRYFITPNKEGTYVVKYIYENSVNRPSKTFTITVEENYVPSELKLATTPTMPKIELGKEVTFSDISLNAGEDTNVDVNITSIKIEKEHSNGEIYAELKDNNMKLTMSPENFVGVDNYAGMIGNYHITYTAVDAYGKTYTGKFKVDGVTVSSNPTIKLAYNHTQGTTYEADDEIFDGVETELKAEYASNSDIVLPAVYVADPVTVNYADFKVIRTIRKGSTYYYVDNLKYVEDTNSFVEVTATERGYNASGDENIGKTNKAVKFKFNSGVATNIEGEYTLEYRVVTNVIKERESVLYSNGTSEKYKFKVVGTHAETTPTIEIKNLTDEAVKNTEKISVNVSATDTLDSRLKTVVFTYSAKKSGATTFAADVKKVADNISSVIKTEKSCHILYDSRLINGIPNEDPTKVILGLKDLYEGIELIKESDVKNSFDLDLSKKSGVVKVAAVTINDDNKVVAAEKDITIKDASDSNSPIIEIDADKLPERWKNDTDPSNVKLKEFSVGQGETVDLPTVYVTDDDKTLSLNVMYYVDSPENSYGGIEYLSPTGKQFYYSSSYGASEVQVVNGGKIITSEVGTYYVAYSATDVAGNTSVMYFTFDVYDTSKPILTVEPTSKTGLKITGNTVSGDVGTVINFESILKSADGERNYTQDAKIDITIDDEGKNLSYQPSGTGRYAYQFDAYGTYYVTVTASVDVTNPDTTVTTLTADKKVIKVVIEKQPLEWLGEFDVPTYAAKGQPVRLPYVAASNGAVVSVTYVAPYQSSADAVEAKPVTVDGYNYWEFTTDATEKGTYKVTYTAQAGDDIITKTFSIKVGDNVPPTLNFNKGELTQDLVYNGESDIEYVLEVNKSKKTFVVKVNNNGQEVYSYDIGLIITDIDDVGNDQYNITWNKLEYELTGPNVKKGDSSTTSGTTTTRYTISGTGKYALTLKSEDLNENLSKTEKIEFNVVEKAAAKKEDNKSVVGAVLIVISLVLLAGVILFFTLTGKKGSASKATKTQTKKSVSKKEKTEVVKEKIDDEPRSGDVE